MSTTTSLIFGAYEGGVIGFDVSVGTAGEVDMEQFMSAPCHIGCVKSSASCGRFAATGGVDEVIQVFDVAKRRQLGNMGGSVHTATISALAVCQKPDLVVSGGEDGQIAITKIKTFQNLRSFQGHKAAVSDIAIHPSGRIALSVSLDNTLRMWDLTRGTCAALRNLTTSSLPKKRSPVSSGLAQMQLRYTPEGTRYALLLLDGKVEICSSSSTEVCTFEGPCTTIAALSEDTFLVGDVKGVVSVIRIDGSTLSVVASLSDSHKSRLRGLARIAPPKDSSDLFAASVCASGRIAITKFSQDILSEVKCLETNTRITTFASNM